MKLYTVESRLVEARVCEPMSEGLIEARLSSPGAVAEVLRAVGLHSSPVEQFYALMLNGKHRLLAVQMVSQGTLNSSLVHPRDVFGAALRLGNVAALILAHNHPSGDPEPSVEDEALTRRLCEAGALLGVTVLDHLILAGGSAAGLRWVSLRERGGFLSC